MAQNVFQASSPPQNRLFFANAVNNINRSRMNWRGTSWIFISLQDDRRRRGQKRDDLYIFLPRWLLPLQTPSLPGDTPEGGQKSIYSFIYWNQLPYFSYFPPDFCPSWPFHCEMIAGQRPKIALLQCFAGNKAPTQMWQNIYHQYISNKVCNQYVLWTRNLNRHP